MLKEKDPSVLVVLVALGLADQDLVHTIILANVVRLARPAGGTILDDTSDQQSGIPER